MACEASILLAGLFRKHSLLPTLESSFCVSLGHTRIGSQAGIRLQDIYWVCRKRRLGVAVCRKLACELASGQSLGAWIPRGVVGGSPRTPLKYDDCLKGLREN
jgi:hypothetical protein